MPIEVFIIPLVLIGTYLFSTFIGYLVHKALHQSWAGALNKAHMTHHLVKYPPRDMISSKYRRAGKDNTMFIFLPIIFLILGIIVALNLIGWLPTLYATIMCIEIAAISLMHEFLHNGFHLNSSIWHKFPRFRKLRALHFEHHRNMKRNFGIVDFFWDRVFKTQTK